MSIWLWIVIGFVVLIGATWIIGGKAFARRQLARLWGWIGHLLRKKKNAPPGPMTNSN